MSSIPAATSMRMRAIRRQGTECESVLETALKRAKLAYRRQVSILKCTADFAFLDERVVVFVDGDFWHGRLLIDGGRRALYRSFKSARREFWITKIVNNVERDRRQTARLRRHGWSVIRLWEKDLLRDPSKALRLLIQRLQSRRLKLPSSGSLSRGL
ncbi:DNA mismatch endonuclease Vsr [Bradyrhizobium sp. HKCCYLRH1030]|uniref:DNA mismatch endonuclease Vsr n=1 Tax=Bradyrhizobium sp. HKCCYLRH1030 TaxID=3420744 RepID=UPI003EBB68B4